MATVSIKPGSLYKFMSKSSSLNVVAFAGGVGGAKLACGLQMALPPASLTVIVNTGDDFEHWGLSICPDIDTVLYNMSGINNPETGWGRKEESFNALQSMGNLGGEDWFRLGDKDLALNLRRSEWLRQGYSLTEVTERLRLALGIQATVLPMSDDPVRTLVHTEEGDLPFQHYFVRRRCEPMLIDLSYVGATEARITDQVRNALEKADLIVFCPSNPYLSIDPILSIAGMRRFVRKLAAPKIAVSPIVGGQAIKGPAAKIMRELGVPISPHTVAEHYDGLLNGFVVDLKEITIDLTLDIPYKQINTIMTDDESRHRLAQDVLDFGEELIASQAKNAVLSAK